MTVDNKALLEYACEKFQEEKYDEALEIFVLLYMRAYEQDWILEMIYSCYMSGNLQEFQNAFEQNADAGDLAYEDCVLDFIPYQDGKYYIYDKELAVFRGIFSCNDLTEADLDAVFDNMEFGAAALELDWNWSEELSVLASAKDRKLYVVAHDWKRCISFFKLPELTEYMKNVKIFSNILEFEEYFHKNTEVYLPKCWKGSRLTDQFADIINREHLYRLTPEGRNTKNVLLTIGIPTASRGHLVLRRLENLLKMPFDAEVEIAISKNCTKHYEEEYHKISQIPDARIQYFDHRKDLNAADNWIYTVEMAHGKYVLFVSDEDDVIIEALGHYLSVILNNPELSVIRACTSFQYIIHEREYKKKGLEAFGRMFLTQNYLSGLIVRKKDFIAGNFRELHVFSDNAFYLNYPHEWWCAFLSKQGDYLLEPVRLISEKESMMEEETQRSREQGTLDEGNAGLIKGTALPAYSTYEARLKQFLGHIEFVHFFMKEDQEGIELALSRVISKTSYLFELALSFRYKLESFLQILDDFTQYCMNGIDEFDLSEERKLHLLDLTGRDVVRLMQIYEAYSSTEARS